MLRGPAGGRLEALVIRILGAWRLYIEVLLRGLQVSDGKVAQIFRWLTKIFGPRTRDFWPLSGDFRVAS